MTTQTLKAEPRKIFGRKVKTLRKEGYLPSNIYGKKVKSQAIQVVLSDFGKVYKQAGETGIVEVLIGGKKRPVLIHQVQVDPVTDIALHADFFQVNLKEKVTAQVPIETTGEAPAEKEGKGTVVMQLDEIEVEALPTDLPDKFEVDLSKLLEVDEAIYVKNLKVDKNKIELKNTADQIIVKVEPLRKEEEVQPPPVSTEEQVQDEEGDEEESGDESKPEEEKEPAKESDKKPSEVKKP